MSSRLKVTMTVDEAQALVEWLQSIAGWAWGVEDWLALEAREWILIVTPKDPHPPTPLEQYEKESLRLKTPKVPQVVSPVERLIAEEGREWFKHGEPA